MRGTLVCNDSFSPRISVLEDSHKECGKISSLPSLLLNYFNIVPLDYIDSPVVGCSQNTCTSSLYLNCSWLQPTMTWTEGCLLIHECLQRLNIQGVKPFLRCAIQHHFKGFLKNYSKIKILNYHEISNDHIHTVQHINVFWIVL